MIDGNIDILSLQGDIVDTLSLEGNLLPIGPKGDKGDDGFSPVVTTSKSGKTTTIKFETATGNVYAYVQDGEDGQGSGDMLTDVYDQNKNGIVDNAEKVNNHTVLTDVPENAVFTDTTYTAGTGIDITNNVISNTNTNAIWGDITGTLSNQTDLQNALDLKANTSAIPTKVSDLTNDSGFIDKTVNNLTNYYTTANTYNKNEVNILIGQIQQFKIQVVETLPVSDIDTHTIYLVPKTGSGNDVYNEYLYINNSWELIGDTTVDLSNYYTKSETDTLLGAKANSSDLSTVATSGSYNDLSNKPTIPDELADLSDDSTHRLVSDTEKETWNNKVDSTGDATTTGENTSFSLTNVLEAPLLMDLKGNTSQYTLSGKNLYNATKSESSSSGITYSCDTQYIYLNNTNSSGTKYEFGSTTLPAGTYSLTLELISGSASKLQTYIYKTGTWTTIQLGSSGWINVQNDSKKASASFTLSEATQISVGSYMNGNAFSNAKVAYQITSGTSSDYNFEPYCDGIPSPNPSYPQNVNVVSGDNDIVVCGKNLFDYDNIIPTTITSRGYSSNASYNSTTKELTFTAINNDTFMPALWPEANFINGINVPVKKNTNYILNCITDDNTHARLGVYGTDGNKYYAIVDSTSTIPLQFNSGNWDQIAIRIGVNGKNGGTIKFSKFQIEEGNQPTTYEPYTLTTYNIDLPVENLIDYDNMKATGGYGNEGYLPSNTNYTTIQYIKVQSNTKYTLTTNIDITKYSGLRVSDFNSSKTFIRRNATIDITSQTQTFTTSSDAVYIALSFWTSGTASISDITQAQLELGTKANSYTPYGTTPIELCKIGTYQDYIYKEDDKWYLHKEVGKVVLDGTENVWSNYVDGNKYYYFGPLINSTKNYETALCDRFTNVLSYPTEIGTFAIRVDGTNLSFLTDIPTLADWKTWLGTNNTIVEYPLKTPTNTEITYQPLLNQLNALEDAESYDGTTNINQVNNDLPFIIGLTAFNDNYNGRYRSLKYMYDKISAGGNN